VFGKLNHYKLPLATLLLIFIAFVPMGCRTRATPPERTAYHWRAAIGPGPYETRFLRDHRIQTLFVRFFDVDLDLASGKPSPIAPLRSLNVDGADVVPVVFITKNALKAMPDSATGTYARLISNRIRSMAQQFGLGSIHEWQIDCDWTAATREKYFAILNKIREEAKADRIQLSVTLRLYPYKYRHEMGVPPADRAMLMCYNMGNLKKPSTRNSILDPAEMKKYLGAGSPYPLPLDAALPLFEWYAWFRGMEYIGLAYPSEVRGLPLLEKNGKIFLARDTVVGGRLFREGDLLRHENVDATSLQKARSLVSKELGQQKAWRLALFHIDSITLSKYSPDALEQVLSGDH
jgi:hypothetical protein